MRGLSLGIISLSVFTGSVRAQTALGRSTSPYPDTARWARELHRAVSRDVDSILIWQGRIQDSLVRSTSEQAEAYELDLRQLTEKLITDAKDSLSIQRVDSLRMANRKCEANIAVFTRDRLAHTKNMVVSFQHDLRTFQATRMHCDDCTKQEDVDALAEDIHSIADSISDRFADTLSALADDSRDALRDTVDGCRDMLRDFTGDMIDRQQDEEAYAAAHATRIVISSGYTSHLAYRGRNSGIDEYAVSPELVFHHRNGLFATASASWLEQAASHWDVFGLGAGYSFEFSRSFTGTISYSRFWFSDSSTQQHAELPNSIDGDFLFQSNVLNLETELDDAFGSASEFSAAFSVSHSFDVEHVLRRGELTFEPTMTAIIGGQNAQLTLNRIRKVTNKKGKVVSLTKTSTKTKNYFGILDYEFSAPVTLEFGPLAIAPVVAYAMPINVIDLSSTSPFLYTTLTVSLTIR